MFGDKRKSPYICGDFRFCRNCGTHDLRFFADIVNSRSVCSSCNLKREKFQKNTRWHSDFSAPMAWDCCITISLFIGKFSRPQVRDVGHASSTLFLSHIIYI